MHLPIQLEQQDRIQVCKNSTNNQNELNARSHASFSDHSFIKISMKNRIIEDEW